MHNVSHNKNRKDIFTIFINKVNIKKLIYSSNLGGKFKNRYGTVRYDLHLETFHLDETLD